jgi:hypothetical protein
LLRGAEVALLGAAMPGNPTGRRGGAPIAPNAPCPTCPGGRAGPGGAYAFPQAPRPAPVAPRPTRLSSEPLALADVAYVISAVLFVLALRGLSSQETARRGNIYGIIGMAIAIGATLSWPHSHFHPLLIGSIIIAAVVGATMALRVGMTQMPEMVALLHSFVGLAAVLVGFSIQLAGHTFLSERIEVYVDVIIGAITTTGSIQSWWSGFAH